MQNKINKTIKVSLTINFFEKKPWGIFETEVNKKEKQTKARLTRIIQGKESVNTEDSFTVIEKNNLNISKNTGNILKVRKNKLNLFEANLNSNVHIKLFNTKTDYLTYINNQKKIKKNKDYISLIKEEFLFFYLNNKINYTNFIKKPLLVKQNIKKLNCKINSFCLFPLNYNYRIEKFQIIKI